MIGYCLAGALLGLAGSLLAFFLVFMLWGLFQGTLEVAMNTQGRGRRKRFNSVP